MERSEFLSIIGKSFFGGAVFLSGCSKLLNQDNPNNLTPASFWQNANDANANLAAVYQNFLGQRGGDCGWNWYYRLVPVLYRGDDIGITHDVAGWWSIAKFLNTDTNGYSGGLWSYNYEGIFRANQVIKNVPGIPGMDAGLKNRMVGEAKFLRAYFYFYLLINFNHIPLITTIPEGRSQYSQAQVPAGQVWGQIEKDLQDAISVLPAGYDTDNAGRITKGAALGYLGKAYLYQQKWQNAADTFEEIINSKTYALLPDFADVFLEEYDNNSEESLLEANYSTTTFSGVDLRCLRDKEEGPSQAGGWYECYPNQWLFTQMTREKTTGGKLDPRVYATIIWPQSGLKYYGMTYNQLFGDGVTEMAWYKYSEAELDHKIEGYSGKNLRVLRYSDILLMHAEALNNLSHTSAAVGSVNKVRNRAQLSSLPAGTSKADLAKEIEHQRVCELADEGNRWYDLLRWGGNIDKSMTIQQNLTAHGAIGAQNYKPGRNEYFPIPLSELQTNTKIKQNPGY